MNREIKFRGKTKEGKWVYGYYCFFRFWERHIIMVDNPPNLEDIEVIPETVGQFTSLHDKNGKEIYKGDIDKNGGVIIWNPKYAGFCLSHGGHDDISLEDAEEWIEIIGNRHDNPELLAEKP